MNFSDPFGLCPQDLSLTQGYLCNLFEAGMTGLGGAAGFIGGGGAGLLTGPGAVVASPALAITGSAVGAGAGLVAGRAISNVMFSKNVGRMNKEVRTGNAPDGVKRVDKGKVKGEQDHVHFRDGSALNENGSWKHGGAELTREIRNWLTKWDWKLP